MLSAQIPPQKGWGRIQRIYLAWENRRTDPKWTAHKKGEVIRKFGPWMDFWMLIRAGHPKNPCT